MTDARGIRLGQCFTVSALGSGGMGEVCHATDLRLGRAVAVGLLPAAAFRTANASHPPDRRPVS